VTENRTNCRQSQRADRRNEPKTKNNVSEVLLKVEPSCKVHCEKEDGSRQSDNRSLGNGSFEADLMSPRHHATQQETQTNDGHRDNPDVMRLVNHWPTAPVFLNNERGHRHYEKKSKTVASLPPFDTTPYANDLPFELMHA
jgi:hypothetical protein